MSIFENTARKGLPKIRWGSNERVKDCYGHLFYMAYGYTKLYSTPEEERSESQKRRNEVSLWCITISVCVVQTLEN